MKNFYAAPFNNHITIFPIIKILKASALHNYKSDYTLSLIFGLFIVFSCVYSGLLFAQDKNDSKNEKVLILAAASDLNFALPEIIMAYKGSNPGVEIKAIFGSSGNLAAQIVNGAPIDIFLSAGLTYIEDLDNRGAIVPDSKSIYGIGRIALWVPDGSKIDIEKSGIKSLLDPSVKKIAIANPQHAPYGKAAVEAMSRLGIYEAVKDKLIFGENISQTAQFIQSGAADIGIIALSIAISPKMKFAGRFWLIPEESYNKMEQWAAIIRSSKNIGLAEDFLNYMKGKEGKKILSRYGFAVPDNQGVK